MTTTATLEASHHPSISGVRVWISGSIPDDATEQQASKIRLFVTKLTEIVFRSGGKIIHGCHPSLMECLTSSAERFLSATGRRPSITLVYSNFFPTGDSVAGIPKSRLAPCAELVATAACPTLDQSLALMRDVLSCQGDVLVAVGGRWWQSIPGQAGVPAEFKLAISRGRPSFLLGGLGGATGGYLSSHPEILKDLRNGMNHQRNVELCHDDDAEACAKVVCEQISLLPLARREASDGQTFRILCLDGGGIRGAFTASVLAKWEKMTGKTLANHFDLICGTSTGGIIALGLGLGLSAQDMAEFYVRKGPQIFPMTGFVRRKWHNFSHWFGGKFSVEPLESALKESYSKAPNGVNLENSSARLLITSYNLTNNSTRLYRTGHSSSVSCHGHLPAAAIARATSAAPTYFISALVDDPGNPHEAVDGGIWSNCPALAAICEAHSVLNIPLDRIEVLSVGTTSAPILIRSPRLSSGKLGWAKIAADLLMKAQSQAVLLQSGQLLGDRFIRVDDSSETDNLDDIRSIPTLVSKGNDIAEKYIDVVRKRFINGVHAANWK